MANIGNLIATLALKNKEFMDAIKQAEAGIAGLDSKSKSFSGGIASDFKKFVGGTAVAGLGAFAGAAVTATTAVLGLAVGLGKMATEASTLPAIEGAFNGLASSFEGGGAAMLKALQEGSRGMVTNADLMKSYNKAAQLVSTDFANTLPEAMSYLGKVSSATGEDMGFMLDSLVKGVGRLSPLILDNLGIQVSLEEANQKYAVSIGKTADQLTKQEQQQAILNETMLKLAENTKNMPDITENAATKLAAFKTTITNLKNEIGVAFLPALVSITDVVKQLAESVLPAVIPFVDAFGKAFSGVIKLLEPGIPIIEDVAKKLSLIGGLFAEGKFEQGSAILGHTITGMVEGLAGAIAPMIEMGGKMIVGLVEGIANALPEVATALMGVVTTLVEAIVPKLPEFLKTGVKIILALIEGITSSLPTLIPLFYEAVLGMYKAVFESIPMIIEAGVKLILGLVEGLINALPVFIEEAPKVIEALVNGLVTALPLLIQGALALVDALITGIDTYLPMLIESAVLIIQTLISGLVEFLPMLVNGAVQLVMAIVMGLINNLPLLVGAAIQLITALIEGIITMIPAIILAAIDLVGGLITGILEAGLALVEVGKELWETIKSGLITGYEHIREVGGNLINALSEGMMSKINDVIAKAKEIAGRILTAVKGIFGIKSPSKEFMEIGENIMTTFSKSIENGTGMAEDAFGQLGTLTANLSNELAANMGDLRPIGAQIVTMIQEGYIGQLASFLAVVQERFKQITGQLLLSVTNYKLIGMTMLINIWLGFETQWQPFLTLLLDKFSTLYEEIGAVIGNVNSIGEEIVIGIAQTMQGNIGSVFAACSNIVSGVKSSLAILGPAGMVAGMSAALGVASGIMAGIGAAVAAAQALAAAVSAALNISWQINSPSKVFQKIGSSVPEGVAKGIRDNWKLAVGAMDELAGSLVPNAKSLASVNDVQGGVVNNYNLTMPTSSNANDIRMAYELMKAYGSV